jgi:hypothetical protein
LWRSLGDLYRVKLKNRDGAKLAYEVALKLKPDAHDVATTLAQLLAGRRDTAPEALEILHRLVREVDDPALPIRELYGIYEPLGVYDRILCCLGALTLMRVPTADEGKLYEVLQKRSDEAARRAQPKALDDKLWRGAVFHPDCRNALADVLSVLYRGAPDLFAGQQAPLELKKKERVDLTQKGRGARSELLYFNVFRQLAQLMQVGEVEHFHRPQSPLPPRLYPGAPAVLFAGELHEAFREMPPKQVTWTLARQLTLARPELAPVRALHPEEVIAAIEGAIRLWIREGSGVDHGADARLVAEWTKRLTVSLGERAKLALKQPVTVCVERGDLKRIAKYLDGAEHTTTRAALLLTNDVRVADRQLAEADSVVEMSYRRRARELMLFTVSNEYFALREHLGVALVNKPA